MRLYGNYTVQNQVFRNRPYLAETRKKNVWGLSTATQDNLDWC
jgi:hypothetical protein